jgi:hypothetical protein
MLVGVWQESLIVRLGLDQGEAGSLLFAAGNTVATGNLTGDLKQVFVAMSPLRLHRAFFG